MVAILQGYSKLGSEIDDLIHKHVLSHQTEMFDSMSM